MSDNTKQLKDQPESDLPAGLSQPALRALHGAGCHTLEQVAAKSEAELKSLHGFGPKGLDLLRGELDKQGLSFAAGERKRSPP